MRPLDSGHGADIEHRWQYHRYLRKYVVNRRKNYRRNAIVEVRSAAFVIIVGVVDNNRIHGSCFRSPSQAAKFATYQRYDCEILHFPTDDIHFILHEPV